MRPRRRHLVLGAARDLPLSANARGALWLLASALAFSLMNAAIKWLGAYGLHAFQITFLRASIGLVVLLPFMASAGRSAFEMRRPGMHLLRGVLGLVAMYATFSALTQLPLASAVSLFFTKPLFMILLAAAFLGERLRWRRSVATGIGFAGVLLMIRPGSELQWPALLAVVAALLMATVMVVVKKMTASERPLTMVFYFSLITTLGGLVPAVLVWSPPDATAWAWIVGMGVAGSLGQYFAVRAYRAGEATAVTPMDYSQMLFAGIIGFAWFGEVPDRWTLAGAAVIAAASVYILWRERRIRGI